MAGEGLWNQDSAVLILKDGTWSGLGGLVVWSGSRTPRLVRRGSYVFTVERTPHGVGKSRE